MRPVRHGTYAVAAALAISVVGVARAEPSSDAMVAMRRGLIEQAQEAREASDHARALDLARRAMQIKTSTSLRRFVAEEEEALGRPAEALGTAELCVREGAADPAQSVHTEVCKAIAERAKRAVGHLLLRVESAPEGMRVLVGGVEAPSVVWGAPYIVSPGNVTVEASADGYSSFRTQVNVVRGDVAEVKIALTKLSPPSSESVSSEKTAEAPAAPDTKKATMSLLVPVGGGVAVAFAATAIVVGLVANGQLADYESRCTAVGAPASCRADQVQLQNDLDTKALIVNVGLAVAAVGAALCVAGLVFGGAGGRTTTARAAKTPFEVRF